jgi:hypothetical protein
MSSADEDASLPLLGDDAIGLPDTDEWPDHVGAALLGIP